MNSFCLLNLCLFSLTQATLGLADHLVLYASLGDSITLPCDVPSCSSINWNMNGEFGSTDAVVKAGRVIDSKSHTFSLVKQCSLHINHLVMDNARIYTCQSGTFNSSVSLQILQISQSEKAETGKIELHCFLNTYQGFAPCNGHGDIHIEWLTETDAHIHGSRFDIQNSTCIYKMTIKFKPTDHRRKWKCRLTQRGSVRASVGYTTTVEDGIQEVFAAVGESVSFSCGNTSSLGARGRMRWSLGGKPLTEDASHTKDQPQPFLINKDSSLVISRVSALHSGNYQCSWPTDEQKVIDKVRLHTFDITSESNPGGDNLTLTCVLTCAATQCEQDFNLTWSGISWHSDVKHVNNMLISKLYLPDHKGGPDRFSCSVSREEAVVASKTWHSVNPLQTAAWSVLPLGLLVCAAAGGIYMKRKHNKDAGNEEQSIGMDTVYDNIEDENIEESRQSQRQRSTSSDSFYDLLQAVN